MPKKRVVIPKFADVREGILEKLNEKLVKGQTGIVENLSLVEGFINLTLEPEPNLITILGPCFPLVMAIGKTSGRAYFFVYQTLGI